MGTQTERRDVHGNGLCGLNLYEGFIFMNSVKAPKLFCHEVAGAPLERFLTAAMVWSVQPCQEN